MPKPTAPGGAPPKSRSVIETDTFCTHCGFNLNTQPVWLDERLKILICRCPECGEHHPAGLKTTAAQNWLNRLALVGLLAWIAIWLSFVAVMFFGLVGMHVAAEEGLMYRQQEDRLGRPITHSYDAKTSTTTWVLESDSSVTVPQEEVVYARYVAPWLPGGKAPSASAWGRPARPIEAGTVAGFFVVGLLIASALLSASSWYWKPWKRYLWLLMPVVVLGLLLLLANVDQGYGPKARQTEKMMYTAVAALQIPVMAIGIFFGRSFVRMSLLLMVPPGARQYFAFLWHCDGKTLPKR